MISNPDLFATTLKMVAALALVLGGMFVVFYFMKRFLNQKAFRGGGELIRILGSTYVGIKKSISLVEIPGAILVLGITNERISLLAKIDDEQTLTSLRRPNETGGQEPFFRYFQKVSQKTSPLESNDPGK